MVLHHYYGLQLNQVLQANKHDALFNNVDNSKECCGK